jgi:hypothetical protein
MESSDRIKSECMKIILSRYDNTEYAGRNVEDILIPDDAADVMCNIFVSELNRKTPHIVFAEIISRPQGNIMKTHAMTIDTLKYYLKDPNAVFTNWVINDDSSEFSQLYYTKLSGEAIRLKRTDNPRGDMFEDILGSTYLHMDNLNVGKGGTHGNRRFFQLSLSTGNYLIDSASILPLYHVSKSTIFVLRPRLVNMKGTKIIDTTRSAGIGSHTSTISGTHGQAPSKMIYELIKYDPMKMHNIFNRPGDETLFINDNGGRDEDDLNEIYRCFKTYKCGYETNEYGHDPNSYMEDIVDLENKAQALETTHADILFTMTQEELNNIHSQKGEIIKEIKESRFNLEEFYQGKQEDIEEDSVNRVDDYSYIFSKYNETKEIPLDRWYGVIDKETGMAPPGGVDPAIIYSDHIPNHEPLFERNNHKQYVKMIIEDENGDLKTICGKILRIFSNLTAFSRLDDDTPEDIFYPQKGQWIYHINFLNGKSIIVAESRREIVIDEQGKETEILKQQIITDEPKPYKVTNKDDFTIQLITQLQAMQTCGSDIQQEFPQNLKPEDLSVLNDEIDNTTFDLLLPVGNALETPMGPDALRIDNESPDGVDNSFTEDDNENHIEIMRGTYLPYPTMDPDRPVRVDGGIMTRAEAINSSAENSPARVAQAENDYFRQMTHPREFPMFPPFLSAPGTGLSDSGILLASLRDDDDDMEEGEVDETDERTSRRHLSAINNLPGDRNLDDMAEAIRMNSQERDSPSSESSSISLFDREDDPRPPPNIRREAASRLAAARLAELGNTQDAINSLSGTRRGRGDFQEENGRNVTPRVGSPLPITPNRMDDLSPLSTPPTTPSRTNSPQVVPETPESQMGNPEYYRRQNEPDEESKEDIN